MLLIVDSNTLHSIMLNILNYVLPLEWKPSFTLLKDKVRR
jgi:hypothetical protein